MIQLQKSWDGIWWNMADGDKCKYDALKATEENEFYEVFDLYKARMERIKNSNHG